MTVSFGLDGNRVGSRNLHSHDRTDVVSQEICGREF
jgi:hypothetical protein